MGKQVKFPVPTERSVDNPAVMCDAQRVQKLYIQETGEQAKRTSPAVKKWFKEAAIEKGWSGAEFVPNAQNNHSAGCLLWVKVERDAAANGGATLTVNEDRSLTLSAPEQT